AYCSPQKPPHPGGSGAGRAKREARQNTEGPATKHKPENKEQQRGHKHRQDGRHGQAGFVLGVLVVHAVHGVLKLGPPRRSGRNVVSGGREASQRQRFYHGGRRGHPGVVQPGLRVKPLSGGQGSLEAGKKCVFWRFAGQRRSKERALGGAAQQPAHQLGHGHIKPNREARLV
nr:hypothetical protein [Tanacetum cinerariifolium]